MNRQSKLDMQFQIERLERKHSQLKASVADLDRHLTLSAFEERRLHELKKEKLATKDALANLRRRPS